jgi:hypothetical protein
MPTPDVCLILVVVAASMAAYLLWILDAAPHLRRFVTKALAMHLADGVWTATERHLFAEVRGQRLAVDVAAMPFVKNTYKR